jgi:multiple sugar transport system substrate-binding protein
MKTIKLLGKLITLPLIVSLAACSGSNGGGTASQTNTNPSTVPTSTTPGTSSSNEKIELKLSFPGADGDKKILDQVLAEFYKDNPNITVTPIYIPNQGWGDYINKLRTMIAGGNSPDVARVAIEGIQMLVKEDMALPLDDYMKKYPDLVKDMSDYQQKIQSSFVVGGKTYGFTWDWNNVVMHLNTNMLKDAGLPMPEANWNKDDFLRYAQALTKEKNGTKTFGFSIPNFYFAASAWLYNNNASPLNEDMTTSKLDDPNAIELMQFFQDLIHKYKVAPVPTPVNNTEQTNQMIQGQVAMISAGRWPFSDYEKNKIDYIDVQYLPTLKTNQPIFGGGAFPVMKSTKHAEAAFKLAVFLGGPYSQKNFLNSRSIPTRTSIMEEVLPKSPPKNWKVYPESAKNAKVVQAPPDYTSVESIFNRYMSAIMTNQMDAASAMKSAKSEIDAALAKK